ncbi:GNAT family N-acetyltransferase [Larsenimonas suaedae]|uniref:GNAT family N-acetyltransferase n=1 Tax=Larsenimonas suaedae TaxID=1851019 RepID=A0ABU1GX30_9GAMM|nr:GNAT family N-acetyltransferase [Larsenimonas suaedae]MCM2973213.1 GNAT family N-acetyltransferase [Larsenimonas suaedae]MDR5896106.1 GNAT family N-acetyltransferase [Larsenimonas suaedae]
MFARLTELLRRDRPRAAAPETAPAPKRASSRLDEARLEDLDWFMTAIEHAARAGHSPWSLTRREQSDVLRQTLELTLRRGLWLQNEYGAVERWQGRVLSYRLGENAPIGMALLTRPDDDAAWQVRFFAIDPEWQTRGHAVSMLMEIRAYFRELPLRTRVPETCETAIHALEHAGFENMHIDANNIVSLEASAQMK